MTTEQGNGIGVKNLKIYLRDISETMVAAWENGEAFGTDRFKDVVKVKCKM